MGKKSNRSLSNPHDQFFRKAMEDKRVATEFLNVHLPEQLRSQIDFSTLKLQPRNHANAVRRESVVDVLFKTNIAGKEGYIYLLLEHQSSPDPLMSFRVIQYIINVIDAHLKTHAKSKIPLVYSLVVYHGKPYQFIRDINELVDAPKELVERYFLKPFDLIDLNQIDDEVIKQTIWSGMMEFALKHIFARDMLPFLRDVGSLLKTLDDDNGRDYIGIVLQYILERAEISDEEAFFKLVNTNVSHETGENIMSLAEKIRLKGKLEGKLEERLILAQKMLSEGVDLAFVARITGFSLEQIQKLQTDCQ